MTSEQLETECAFRQLLSGLREKGQLYHLDDSPQNIECFTEEEADKVGAAVSEFRTQLGNDRLWEIASPYLSGKEAFEEETARSIADYLLSAGYTVTGVEEGDDEADGLVQVTECVHIQVPTYGGNPGVVVERADTFYFYPQSPTPSALCATLSDAIDTGMKGHPDTASLEDRQ